jgi:hypothetical protein
MRTDTRPILAKSQILIMTTTTAQPDTVSGSSLSRAVRPQEVVGVEPLPVIDVPLVPTAMPDEQVWRGPVTGFARGMLRRVLRDADAELAR